MIAITDRDHAEKAKYQLECALIDGGERQVILSDLPLATLKRENIELSVEWGKLILTWWDEHSSQSRRVTAYQIEPAELRLHVARGPAREISLLILRDPLRWAAARQDRDCGLDERRKNYAILLAGLIKSGFPGIHLENLAAGANQSRSAWGRYARLCLRLNGTHALVIGVTEAESQSEIDGVVATGLAWLSIYNQKREAERRAKRLWICLPQNRSLTAIERLSLVDVSHLDAQIDCFEIDEEGEEIRAVIPATQTELLNAHSDELSWPAKPLKLNRWRERILGLAPDFAGLADLADLIEARRLPGDGGESYSYHGLEFARTGADQEIKFGVPGLRSEGNDSNLVFLTERNFRELERLVGEIARYRSPRSADRRHPFYRLRAEAWLESLLRQKICALDTALDERFVYSQIPTWRADQRSVIDLLALRREGRNQGRLAVIEIKAAEDPQLPMQGLDYWLRVEQARLRGEFAGRGLFTGVRIVDRTPLLYLVAPRLRFHRTFTAVARCLDPQIEAYRIGINTNWREGVKIHARERINGS